MKNKKMLLPLILASTASLSTVGVYNLTNENNQQMFVNKVGAIGDSFEVNPINYLSDDDDSDGIIDNSANPNQAAQEEIKITVTQETDDLGDIGNIAIDPFIYEIALNSANKWDGSTNIWIKFPSIDKTKAKASFLQAWGVDEVGTPVKIAASFFGMLSVDKTPQQASTWKFYDSFDGSDLKALTNFKFYIGDGTITGITNLENFETKVGVSNIYDLHIDNIPINTAKPTTDPIDPNDVIQNDAGDEANINIDVNFGSQTQDIGNYRVVVYKGEGGVDFDVPVTGDADFNSASQIANSAFDTMSSSFDPANTNVNVDVALKSLVPGVDYTFTLVIGAKTNSDNQWVYSDAQVFHVQTKYNQSTYSGTVDVTSYDSATFNYDFAQNSDVFLATDEQITFNLYDKNDLTTPIKTTTSKNWNGSYNLSNLHENTTYQIGGTVKASVINSSSTVNTYDLPTIDFTTNDLTELTFNSIDNTVNSDTEATINWDVTPNDETITKQTITIVDDKGNTVIDQQNLDTTLRTFDATGLSSNTNFTATIDLETSPSENKYSNSTDFTTLRKQMVPGNLVASNIDNKNATISWNIVENDEPIKDTVLTITNVDDSSTQDIDLGVATSGDQKLTGLLEQTHYSAKAIITKWDDSTVEIPEQDFYTSETTPIFDTTLTRTSGSIATTIEWNIVDANGNTIDDSRITKLGLIETDPSSVSTTYDITSVVKTAKGQITISNGMTLDGKTINLVEGSEYNWEVSANVSMMDSSNSSTSPVSKNVDIKSEKLPATIGSYKAAIFNSSTISEETPEPGKRNAIINYDLVINDDELMNVDLLKNGVVIDTYDPTLTSVTAFSDKFIIPATPGQVINDDEYSIKAYFAQIDDPTNASTPICVEHNLSPEHVIGTTISDLIPPVINGGGGSTTPIETLDEVTGNTISFEWDSINTGEYTPSKLEIIADQDPSKHFETTTFDKAGNAVFDELEYDSDYTFTFNIYGTPLSSTLKASGDAIIYTWTSDSIHTGVAPEKPSSNVAGIIIGIIFGLLFLLILLLVLWYFLMYRKELKELREKDKDLKNERKIKELRIKHPIKKDDKEEPNSTIFDFLIPLAELIDPLFDKDEETKKAEKEAKLKAKQEKINAKETEINKEKEDKKNNKA